MGWNFRKSFKILPGVRMNVSKRGISGFTFGKRGASISTGKRGTHANLGIPGTGLSYRTRLSGPRQNNGQQKKSGCLPLVLAFVFVAVILQSCISSFGSKSVPTEPVKPLLSQPSQTTGNGDFKPIPYVAPAATANEVDKSESEKQRIREEVRQWRESDEQLRQVAPKGGESSNSYYAPPVTSQGNSLNGGSRRNICGGSKGGISHCEGTRYRCNDGSFSGTTKSCTR